MKGAKDEKVSKGCETIISVHKIDQMEVVLARNPLMFTLRRR